MSYISEKSVEEIKRKADIIDIIGEFIPLTKKGKDYVGFSPWETHKQKKFSVDPKKEIWKCWLTDKGGKGSISFLQEFKGWTYPEALKYIANKYNLLIEYTQEEAQPKASVTLSKASSAMVTRDKTKKMSFRDEQLIASGLTEDDVKGTVTDDDGTERTISLYQAATINDRGDIVAGDDMVMHYLDLTGKRIQYVKKGTTKPLPLTRVRWQNPSLHTDKQGREIKYQSPYGSGTHLWIPEVLRKKFKARSQFDTLYIQEGEKKADKASKHGLTSVGIMGIHNIAGKDRQLPHEFELIIKTCGVKNVVFVVDSDWQDISNNINNPADERPRSFFSAIRNYRDYFKRFANAGLHVEIFFGAVKKNNASEKGIDDLLNGSLKGQEDRLHKELVECITDPHQQGKLVELHKITTLAETKLLEFFHLNHNDAFIDFHKEVLKERRTFKLGRISYEFDESGQWKLTQPVMPDEEFWKEESYYNKQGREVKQIAFHYGNCYNFLQKRNYGRYRTADGKFKLIAVDGRVLREVDHTEVRDYIITFAKNVLNKDNVSEMLYRGVKSYLGPDSLSNLDYVNPKVQRADKNLQYMFFQNHYWKITKDGVETGLMSDFIDHVWNTDIVDSDIRSYDPVIRVVEINEDLLQSSPKAEHLKGFLGKHLVEFTERGLGDTIENGCQFARFLWNTCNFDKERDFNKWSFNDQMEATQHFMSKITAIGYLLHGYRNNSILKAIVAMDGKLTEIGSSHGRSGKSLIGAAIEQVTKTVTIPGKRKDLTDDRFIFEEVDERTRILFFDDVRVNFDFEFLFPVITGKMQVDGKGVKKFTLPIDQTPKVLITTNHALNGEGSSFRDRQHLIAFSDFYNEKHKPENDFGGQFFHDWNAEQWRLFYSFMAQCVQIYLRYGLVAAPSEKLELRRQRQQIGEAVIDWADTFFDPTANNINVQVARKTCLDSFYEAFPRQRNYIDSRDFKRRLQLYCKFKGLIFNPNKQRDHELHGGDIKTGGVEYFIIANSDYFKETGQSIIPFA